MASEARMRALYALNIVIPGGLAVYHLLSPGQAADQLWRSPVGTLGRPSLAYPMLGSWWAGIALISLLGLREPLKYSPIMLLQVLYKLAFLGSSILPLALAGRWSEFPAVPTAIYTAFLLPLFVCAPWGYLLGGARAAAGRGKAE